MILNSQDVISYASVNTKSSSSEIRKMIYIIEDDVKRNIIGVEMYNEMESDLAYSDINALQKFDKTVTYVLGDRIVFREKVYDVNVASITNSIPTEYNTDYVLVNKFISDKWNLLFSRYLGSLISNKIILSIATTSTYKFSEIGISRSANDETLIADVQDLRQYQNELGNIVQLIEQNMHEYIIENNTLYSNYKKLKKDKKLKRKATRKINISKMNL